MSLLEWRDSFRIGIDEVDFEHRELIELINGASAGVERGETGEPLDAVLGEIHAVISAHFALEERVMQARNYPARDEHKADHERLLDDIRDLMDEVADRHVLDWPAFGVRLAEWFTVHFSTHDARLHRHLAG